MIYHLLFWPVLIFTNCFKEMLCCFFDHYQEQNYFRIQIDQWHMQWMRVDMFKLVISLSHREKTREYDITTKGW